MKEAPPQEDLKAPSIEELEELVGGMSNTYDTREEWIKVGYAIRAAAQDDVAAGLQIWQEFSARWEGENDPDLVEREWESFVPFFRVGWDWLKSQAFDIRDLFEADLDIAQPDSTESSSGFLRGIRSTELLSDVDWQDLPAALDRVHSAMSDLPQRERQIVEAAATRELRDQVGSMAEARRLLRLYAPPSERGGFTRDQAGAPLLRELTADDVAVEGRYLVEGRVPAGGVGALVSNFSLGKTWLAIDLGLSVAFGCPWLGSETSQSPVIFLIAEGHRDFPIRILGWLVEHDLLSEDSTVEEFFEVLDGRVVINRYPTRFDDPVFEEGLIATLEQTGARLLIVDTLGKTLGPEQSENDNDVANEITGMLSRIAAQTDCTTIFTHHVGHADRNRARGASGWEQGLDFEYVIKGKRRDFANGQPVILKARKMRDGPPPPTESFRLKTLPGLSLAKGVDGEVEIVTSAVVEHVDVQSALPPLARVFRYIKNDSGCAAKHIRKQVEGGSSTIDRAVGQLRRLGAIENRGTGNRHRYHTTPGWGVVHGGNVENLAEPFKSHLSDLVDESASEDEEVGS